jgi:hypothetical protein
MSAESENHQMTHANGQALGRLEGAILSMQQLQERILREIERDREDSRQTREKQAAQIEEVKGIVESLQRDMDQVKPLTEKWKRWQLIGWGVILTCGAVGTVVGATLNTFRQQIVAWLFP